MKAHTLTLKSGKRMTVLSAVHDIDELKRQLEITMCWVFAGDELNGIDTPQNINNTHDSHR